MFIIINELQAELNQTALPTKQPTNHPQQLNPGDGHRGYDYYY